MSLKLGNLDINKIYLGNTEVNKVYLGNTEVFGGGTTPSANLILNGTFDNEDNISFGPNWSVGGGVASYDYLSTSGMSMTLSSNLIIGNSYTLTFEISNASSVARILSREQGSTNENLNGTSIISYANGSHSITFTAQLADTNSIGMVAYASSGSTFDLDNVTLTEN